MLAKVLTVLVAAVMSVLVGASSASSVSSAPADPYQPVPKPVCSIKVKAKAGERVKIVVGARINAADQPSGTITVRLAARDVWVRTVRTDGSPATLLGPVVPRGTHRITTRFVPDDATESRQCQGEVAFTVGTRGNGDENGDNDSDAEGILPNTGGPNLLWLLLGLSLVGGGATAIVYARRRETTPALA